MEQVAEQPSFPELEFDEGRTALTVAECARKLDFTEEHIISLIECGDLRALNCATSHNTMRVPRAFITAMATRLGVPESEILAEVEKHRAAEPARRPSWRIPPSAWKTFLSARAR